MFSRFPKLSVWHAATSHKIHPFLHALDVLSLLFLTIFIFVDISLPLCTSHPPTDSPLHCNRSYSAIPSPPPSVCQCLDHVHPLLLHDILSKRAALLSPPNSLSFMTRILLLLAGDVHVNPGPSSSSVQFAHLNIHSAASVTADLDKPTLLCEFISDQDLEILALSETWLAPDSLPSVLNSLTPPNYSIISNPRPVGVGGGVAFIYRSYLKMSQVQLPTFSSFESLCIKLTIRSSSIIFLTIYRPPSTSFSTFLSEFSTLLDDLNCAPSELIISGDFNVHVDQPSEHSPKSFLSTLESYNLTQHVHFPTHNLGHTLDLLITRSTSNIISSTDWTIPFISDHYAIHSTVSVPFQHRPSRITKLVRCFRSVDTSAFSNDVLSSDLYSSSPTSLESYLHTFNSVLSSLIDKHAPLKSVSCPSKNKKPFITPDIRAQKTIRSKLESRYRRTHSAADLINFKNQSRTLSKLITNARRNYFRTNIADNKNNPRQLWSTLNTLLSRKLPKCLPTHLSVPQLADDFLKFFDGKISKLTSVFSASPSSSPHILPPTPPPLIESFPPATPEEVKTAILASSNATCMLDIIPTPFLKSCLDSLVHPITRLINLSLAEGMFPNAYKQALVSPRLKKHNLPTEDLSSYRPISNLNFISKILERIIHTRLSAHVQSSSLLTPFQSAYRHLHSTETALLRIQNDLLNAFDQQKVSALVLLDLSAAFDTIDHQILLTRLSSFYGITGSALKLLSSYLLNRTQSICIDSQTTAPSPMHTGIPQGSVLGPLLFSLYTSPLSHLFNDSPISFHLYADDTQLYISFSASDADSSLTTLSSKLDHVHAWLTSNRLTVNPSKTEFLIIGSSMQRSKLTNPTVSLCNNSIAPSPSARNLGIIFDNDLSLKKHISSVCQQSYLQIRQLRQIRSALDTKSAIILANSLVSSRLDYCNSLYHGLPDCSIARLQRIQNSLARVVMPFVKRHDHITPALQKLHWLPIRQRITFKIATLTFKTLQHSKPAYLFDLITPHKPSRTLRSSSQNQLVIPRITSETGRRSFAYAAPTIWNSLPLALKTTTSLSTFHSLLKTHLFPT
jgi:exonuclease III